MPEINANIVVEPYEITITTTNDQIAVTPNVTELRIFTNDSAPGGFPGDIQYNANGVLGGVPTANYVAGNLRLGNSTNLKITGGSNAYFLQTDGTGNLTWAPGTANVSGNGTAAGANNQIQLSDGSGNFKSAPGFAFDTASNYFTAPGNGLFSGILAANSANINNNAINLNGDGSINADGNITSENIIRGEFVISNVSITSFANVGGPAYSLIGNGFSGQAIDFNIYTNNTNPATTMRTYYANGTSTSPTALGNGQTFARFNHVTYADSGNTLEVGATLVHNISNNFGNGTVTVESTISGGIGPNGQDNSKLNLNYGITKTYGKLGTGNSLYVGSDTNVTQGTGTLYAGNANIGNGNTDLYSNGYIDTVANVNASYYFGNGAFLTGIDTSLISNGNSNVRVYNNANVAVSINGVSNVIVVSDTNTNFTTNVITNANIISNNANLGNLAVANYLTGTLTTNAQPNIDNLGNGQVTVNGNLIANNANLGNLAVANYLTGTLTTNAQPNITSVGNLTSLNITGNLSANNANFTEFANANNITATSNMSANNANFTEFANANNITATANVTAGNVYANSGTISALTLKGEGGNISNVTAGNITGQVANALVAGTVYTNAQPNITSVGTLSSLVVTGNASAGNISTGGILSVIGNANVGNIGATNGVFTNVSGNGSGLSALTGGNVTGQVGNALVAGTVYTNAQPNITSVGTLSSLAVTGNATAGNVYANSGTIGASLLAGTLTTAAQPNVTSVGNLTDLRISNTMLHLGFNAGLTQGTRAVAIGDSAGSLLQGSQAIAIGYAAGISNQGANAIALGHNAGQNGQGAFSIAIGRNAGPNVQQTNTIILNATGNDLFGNTANATYVKPIRNVVYGNTLNYDPTTGEIGYSVISVNAGSSLNNGTSNVVVESNGNVNFGIAGTANRVQFTSAGANITGTLNVTSNASVGNISATQGTFTNVSGNGSALSSITGGNVTGQVSNALVAGTVYTAAQPNITSVGNLSNLTVVGNASAANFTGNHYGNGAGLTNVTAVLANVANNVVVTETVATIVYPVFVTSTGNGALQLDSVGNTFYYVPNQGRLVVNKVFANLDNDTGEIVGLDGTNNSVKISVTGSNDALVISNANSILESTKAASTATDTTISHKIPIVLNGTTYYIALTANV